VAPNNVGRASEWTAGPRQGAPEGWHNVVSTEVGSGPRGHLFYGYAASNKCCKDWLLLGWPSTPDGRPVHRGATADPVLGLTCPKCGGMIYFDIAHWDTCTEIADPEAAQPAVLVGGRFSVGTKATPRRA